MFPQIESEQIQMTWLCNQITSSQQDYLWGFQEQLTESIFFPPDRLIS